MVSDFNKDWIDFLEKGTYKDKIIFTKFVIVWIAFNSYYSQKYKHINGDKNKVIRFSEDHMKFYEELRKKDDCFKEIVNNFRKTKSNDREFVIDLNNERRKYYFNDVNNSSKDFFKAIYQIRCNLIHGDKCPSDAGDEKIVQWAFNSLFVFWKEFIRNAETKIQTN